MFDEKYSKSNKDQYLLMIHHWNRQTWADSIRLRVRSRWALLELVQWSEFLFIFEQSNQLERQENHCNVEQKLGQVRSNKKFFVVVDLTLIFDSFSFNQTMFDFPLKLNTVRTVSKSFQFVRNFSSFGFDFVRDLPDQLTGNFIEKRESFSSSWVETIELFVNWQIDLIWSKFNNSSLNSCLKVDQRLRSFLSDVKWSTKRQIFSIWSNVNQR